MQAGELKFLDRTGQRWQLTLGSQSTISKEDLWVFAVEMGALSVQDHTHKSMKTGSIVSPF